MNNYAWLDGYLLSRPGAVKDYKAEWEWMRYQVGGKLFAAICQPGPEYSQYDCRELISLKCEPELSELFRTQYADVIPGFYMDKRNWNSIYLDGEVPEDVLRGMCERSYALVFGKLTKKEQREITESAQKDEK